MEVYRNIRKYAETFVYKGYIGGKSEKSINTGEPTFHAEKTDCSSKPKCMFYFSAANYSQKLHKKYSIRAVAHGIR